MSIHCQRRPGKDGKACVTPVPVTLGQQEDPGAQPPGSAAALAHAGPWGTIKAESMGHAQLFSSSGAAHTRVSEAEGLSPLARHGPKDFSQEALHPALSKLCPGAEGCPEPCLVGRVVLGMGASSCGQTAAPTALLLLASFLQGGCSTPLASTGLPPVPLTIVGSSSLVPWLGPLALSCTLNPGSA